MSGRTSVRPYSCSGVFALNYEESLTYIHALERFGIQPGLERVAALCERLDNPQNSLHFVHVAGTNGKGSTSAMIAGILQSAGYRTGLFTSPYVLDFCERIQIDGAMIGQDEMAAVTSRIEPCIEALAAEGTQITEFEAITAAAFLYFKQCSCDIVVLETGLGGRFDATNIIAPPVVGVITSVSLDHMAILGDTLEKIAYEKAGILKPGSSTVLYPIQFPEVTRVFERVALQKDNTLILPSLESLHRLNESVEGSAVEVDGIRIFVPFMGEHMVYNAVVAVHAARELTRKGFVIPEDAVIRGIRAATMPARMEYFPGQPGVLLDGGHNEGCAHALAACMERFFAGKTIVAVCGMMADKEYGQYLSITAPFFHTLIVTKPSVPRALGTAELAEEARLYCDTVLTEPDALKAYERALSIAENEAVIFVCGSFYLASEIRPRILNKGNAGE